VRDYLVDERGRLRKHVNIFIGDAMVRDRAALSDPIADDAEVFIFQALSGG
jgi:molybdopterin converting factor small subunit